MARFKVDVHIADHVEHKGWVSRPEVFDTFEMVCAEEDQMRIAHSTFEGRHPEPFADNSFTFKIYLPV